MHGCSPRAYKAIGILPGQFMPHRGRGSRQSRRGNHTIPGLFKAIQSQADLLEQFLQSKQRRDRRAAQRAAKQAAREAAGLGEPTTLTQHWRPLDPSPPSPLPAEDPVQEAEDPVQDAEDEWSQAPTQPVPRGPWYPFDSECHKSSCSRRGFCGDLAREQARTSRNQDLVAAIEAIDKALTDEIPDERS